MIGNKPFKNGTKNAFVDYLSNEFTDWAATPNRDIVNDVFTINLALSIMKPLLPTFVEKGLAALKTESMKIAIRECFQNQGCLRIARLQETYALATAELTEEEAEELPAEVETEDDLGTIVHEDNDQQPNINEDLGLAFMVEVGNVAGEVGVADETPPAKSSSVSSSDSESSSSSDEEPPVREQYVPILSNPKRVRKQNVMVGSVRKGKYSVMY